MEDSDLSKDVEVSKSLGLFFVAIRIEVWSLGKILSAAVFIPDVIAASMLAGGMVEEVWQSAL